MRNGWHTICNWKVWVEDGNIIYSVIDDNNGMRYLYPVVLVKDGRYWKWEFTPDISVSAFRHKWKCCHAGMKECGTNYVHDILS